MNSRTVFVALLVAFFAAGGSSCAQQKKESPEKMGTDAKRHGWLGVSIQDLTPRLARERETSAKSGALVNDVIDDSPADKAGIKEDDVIIEFNGKAVEEANDLLQAVRAAAPGSEASLVLLRGKDRKTIDLTLESEPHHHFAMNFHGPSMVQIPPIPPMHFMSQQELLGMTMSDLKGQLGEYFQAPGGRGVLVQEVKRSSSSDKAGFKAGDVIIKVNGESVVSVGEINEALDDVKKGDTVAFDIIRRGEPKTLSVQAEVRSGGRWFRFRSEGNDDDASFFGIRPEVMKHEMERLKDDFRTLGDRIRSEVGQLRRSVHSVI
ncbi:MAG TPA: PDZ domain-containing protein [Bacteroidota bacterium]|nr:PDZ domain-containing protein [Bacteroidota bacterium]